MHYCSKDSWIFHRNDCSAHTGDWRTHTQTEQRCSQRARKSRLKPLRAAVHKQIFFLFVAAVYLLLRRCCFWLYWLSMWGGVLCWTWLVNRVTLIFDPLVYIVAYCHIKEPLLGMIIPWAHTPSPHPLQITHTETCGLILVLQCITVSCFGWISLCQMDVIKIYTHLKDY